MVTEPDVAFVSIDSPLEITTNFGVFAGRDVSREEIDRLGRELMSLVSGLTLFAGRRYEFAAGAAEVAAYEIRARFDESLLPAERARREELIGQLLAATTAWARGAAATPPPTEEDIASRIVRGSAADAWRDDAS